MGGGAGFISGAPSTTSPTASPQSWQAGPRGCLSSSAQPSSALARALEWVKEPSPGWECRSSGLAA